jgi:alkylation response protein AidB-like acyl-CoA dehydrogenase
VFWDELARRGGGWLAACFLTVNIALPPILALGSEKMKQEVAVPLIKGEKIIALAITEPYAGSDVANIQTVAVRDGNDFVVGGVCVCDCITNACTDWLIGVLHCRSVVKRNLSLRA